MKKFIQEIKIRMQHKEFWILQAYQISRLVKWIANNALVVASVFLLTFIFYCGMRELFQYLQVSDEQVRTMYSRMITTATNMIMLIIAGMTYGWGFAKLLCNRNISFTKMLKAVWIYVLVVISFYFFTSISLESKLLRVEQTLLYMVWIIAVIIVLTSIVQELFLWWLKRNAFVQSMHDLKKTKNIDGEQIHAKPSEFIQVKEQWEKYIYLKNTALCDECVYKSSNDGVNTRKVLLFYEIKYISTSILITICQESVWVQKILKQEHKHKIAEGV